MKSIWFPIYSSISKYFMAPLENKKIFTLPVQDDMVTKTIWFYFANTDGQAKFNCKIMHYFEKNRLLFLMHISCQ